ERWTSACSPGRSIVARTVPAGGAGSANDARPGVNVSGAPHSSVSANGPGPGSSAVCASPSATSGRGRPPAVASTSVAPARRLTRATPGRRTSPATLNAPCAVSRSTRTRKSALDSTAATGAAVDVCGGRPARSISLLYSVTESVTVRGDSTGLSGCCAAAMFVIAANAAANVVVVGLVIGHLYLARLYASSTDGELASAV